MLEGTEGHRRAQEGTGGHRRARECIKNPGTSGACLVITFRAIKINESFRLDGRGTRLTVAHPSPRTVLLFLLVL